MEVIKRGAEAEIYLTNWHNRHVIIKKRVKKGYRIDKLDKAIREKRTKKEAMLMTAARQAKVSVPIIYDVRPKHYEIVMQYLNGDRIKDTIDQKREEEQKSICTKIGRAIARLHEYEIIHGDLTTSNMIMMNDTLYLIDFGLGMKKNDDESRGVDLHVLMEAFKAAHRNKKLFTWVLQTYEEGYDDAHPVKKKIREISQRGRYMRRVS